MTDKTFMTVTKLGFEIVYKILESQKKRIDALERMHGGVSEKIGGTSSDA